MKLIEPGRVAAIMGGARGIGFAAARLLASEGARLALVDINRDGAVRAAKRLADETKAEVIGFGADITSPAEVTGFVNAVTGHFGRIDIFINSAAVLDDKRFLESSPADWDRMLKICLTGPMNCLHTILPGMVERKYGRVVCLASDSARIPQILRSQPSWASRCATPKPIPRLPPVTRAMGLGMAQTPCHESYIIYHIGNPGDRHGIPR